MTSRFDRVGRHALEAMPYIERRLPLASVWTGFRGMTNHSNQIHHIAFHGGDLSAQGAL